MLSFSRIASFVTGIVTMLAFLSLVTGYATSGPEHSLSGKKSAMTPLHPRTMLPSGIPNQPLRSTNSELDMLHPRTNLPTTAALPNNNMEHLATPRRTNTPLLPFLFPKRRRKKSQQFMTMGEVVSSSNNNNGSLTPKWLERLQNISNIASLLCVLDCTILPVVTILLPLLGIAASPAQMEWMHGVGHSVAMYFVMPVGGSAAIMNFLSHKEPLISLPALLGLALVYLANAHGGPILAHLPHGFVHAMHCGTVWHRVANIAGCGLLLGSNYISHRMGCSSNHKHGGKECGC